DSELHRPQLRVHPAGDLQPRRARKTCLPDRSSAQRPRKGTSRTAGKRHRAGAAKMNGRAAAHEIAIDVHGLTKRFDGRAVVRNLSMQVRRGTIYGFLGPNGSGKTTT